MASDTTTRRRLHRMRDTRVEALRTQARRAAALDLLDEAGEVTSAAVDARMEATWAPPSDAALANLLAQKTAAGVEYETRELDAARDAAARAEDRVGKFRALLAAAEEGAENARQAVADSEARRSEALALAEMAGGIGDASAAPAGEAVTVSPDTADGTTGA